ncbi:sodium ABC transporter ATP-binding protein [Aerococcus urinaehominis]|uniref:Sodium ABC transporter ATP-binding protein n=1 Tax=Aerococcus urinaehominis TaxID=128944 RepID=A0A109RHH1_9LACT|nr:ABC transporter ATP-binding protein [Aerococcus urinaehominis]AMB98560.1 sodium ABC transporter ATP-binding protein [Aerococcus urinaehominis]SDL77978.1 ABC-2 type transport system ATP-binding protein [Aerococcus urinaehominis]
MLAVSHLSKSFGSVQAVDDLSFTVKPGEIMGLIGQNGSGKTTTFRMILQLLVPDQGEVTWQGQQMSSQFFDQLGYLPEERGLYPKLTVEEQIVYFAQLRGMAKDEVLAVIDQWLADFQVKGQRQDKIQSLSKGNQQKVQLITTLIHQPKLIILDEPFSGLDPVNAGLLEAGVQRASQAGAAIIFSSHNMDNVGKLCDHLVMLQNGQTLLQGELQAIRQQFGQTRLFVETDWSDQDLLALPGVSAVHHENNGMQKLILSDPDQGPAIFNQLSQGHYIKTFSQQPPSLEEIFKMKAGEKS